MINLHKEFTKQHPEVSLSYSSFCSLRPFYVTAPKPSDRKTCQCRVHLNAKMMLKVLREHGITESSRLEDSFELVCCSPPGEACLLRVWTPCFHKSTPVSAQQDLINVKWQQWERVRDCEAGESHHNSKLVTHTGTLVELTWLYEDLKKSHVLG